MLLHMQPGVPRQPARLQWRHEHIEPLATGPAHRGWTRTPVEQLSVDVRQAASALRSYLPG